VGEARAEVERDLGRVREELRLRKEPLDVAQGEILNVVSRG
jgi:hypothetical protein